MRGLLARAVREQLPTEDDDEPEVDRWADPTYDEAMLEAVYDFMRELVEKWESRNPRTAALLVLEAGKRLEPLSNAELGPTASRRPPRTHGDRRIPRRYR